MRCATCGSGIPDEATTCRGCGRPVRGPDARATARHSSHYKKAEALDRHLLLRAGADPLELQPGKDLLLGRASDCDLVIHSSKVSRQHARIAWRDGAPVLVDLGSENGTLVNGAPVRERPLNDGDELALGPYPFTYRHLRAAGSVQTVQELLDSQADTQPLDAVALSGRLEEIGLAEVLDTLHYNQRTGTLLVHGPSSAEGSFGLRDGAAVYAYAGGREGAVAAFAMLGWREGLFSFSTELANRRPNLRQPIPALLEEFQRRHPGPDDYRQAERAAKG